VKCQLKTNCVVAALPQAELTKMLKKFARLSLQIVIGPLTNFWNKRLFMPMHFNGRFDDEMGCCKIRAASAHRQARQQVCECLLICRKSSKWPSVSHKSHNRWWELVLGYDPESKQQSSQWKSPDSPRPKTVLQVHSSIKTLLFFFLCWWDFAQGVCSSRTNNKSAVLLECGETIAWEPATKTSREVAEWGLVLAPWQCPRNLSLMLLRFSENR
jgi:hypothetical protein